MVNFDIKLFINFSTEVVDSNFIFYIVMLNQSFFFIFVFSVQLGNSK